MDYNKLAELLFPDVVNGPDYYEKKFPERDLPKGAEVTRMAPSPTGFIHLGNLYSALADERIAHRNGGVFYLRIEDTDEKRKVDGAVETIINVLRYFDIEFDEGAGFTDADPQNVYGPYFQRQRVEIYHAYAKDLVKRGLAYPCFCTEEELEEVRKEQEEDKAMTGYYGKYAVCRNLTLEDIEAKLKAGLTYVLRLRSAGSPDKEIVFHDRIMGEIKLPENIHDIVLLKRDGVPTYHFAHAIDDHLMRTTMVIRGGEWLASVPTHYELFHVLGFKMPSYGHTAHLMKFDEETGGKRKLSKRKDPELGLEYYRSEGYAPRAVWEYLMTVLNSNFEEWRLENPDAPIDDFKFSLDKMSNSGALFDIMKFEDVSREVLLRTPANKIYDEFSDWLKEYDPEFYKLFTRDKNYSEKIIDVGRNGNRPRKDLTSWKQARDFFSFYFPETFKVEDEFPERVSKEDRYKILKQYLTSFNIKDDNSEWFQKIRDITESMGYAVKPKDFKKNPDMYKGSVSDVSGVIRVAITGRTNSPDLWEICQIIGEDEMTRRINLAIAG